MWGLSTWTSVVGHYGGRGVWIKIQQMYQSMAHCIVEEILLWHSLSGYMLKSFFSLGTALLSTVLELSTWIWKKKFWIGSYTPFDLKFIVISNTIILAHV